MDGSVTPRHMRRQESSAVSHLLENTENHWDLLCVEKFLRHQRQAGFGISLQFIVAVVVLNWRNLEEKPENWLVGNQGLCLVRAFCCKWMHFTLNRSGSKRSWSATGVEKERPALAINHFSTAYVREILDWYSELHTLTKRHPGSSDHVLELRRTCFEELDCLCPLVLLFHFVLLDHVILDLLVALCEGFELQQNSLCEVWNTRRCSRLRVGQVDINHEDVSEHTVKKNKHGFSGFVLINTTFSSSKSVKRTSPADTFPDIFVDLCEFGL